MNERSDLIPEYLQEPQSQNNIGIRVYQATNETPYVQLNERLRAVLIRGKSVSDNVPEFYAEIYNWASKCLNEHRELTLMLAFDELCLNTIVMLMDVFHEMEKVKQAGGEVEVNWFSRNKDEGMRLVGVEYAHQFDIPFNTISKNF
ncbi:SiaC family regulatory phosphoprotein [Marinoscillum furvescens]|uniref:Uncharacterized protein DUF1987 n=1 Tax=Marinoscillum furvescens DSM 4134 TaxID=1122208 RepID=A0A3D9LJA5_MARFU|nr:SiaC family regulatory phosphoprotein [Marinoscillum furvescens]REE05955.1 uncharacterized protein DUF1987 [Marinoscillum furvescens DSM 4134]